MIKPSANLWIIKDVVCMPRGRERDIPRLLISYPMIIPSARLWNEKLTASNNILACENLKLRDDKKNINTKPKMKQSKRVIEYIFRPRLMPNCDELTIKSINKANMIPREILFRADFVTLLRLFKTRKNIPIKVGIMPRTITRPTRANGSVIK